MNRVLVTGGAGYIGSHACKYLRQSGKEPVSFDSLSTGWEQAVKFGPFEWGDLLDREHLDRVFAKYKPDTVMHFAAFAQVGESYENPGLYWQNNVLGSLNLIEAAVAAGCKDIVFSSTCAVYGDQDDVLLDEDCQLFPTNAYASSKRAIEEILRDFGSSHGLRYTIFRYFNVAGADPEGEIGEFHRPETHLVPIILDALTGKRDAVTIHGTDYPTPDGTGIRDYVHVVDLVKAHLLGMEWLKDGKPSRVFNLGTGHGFSVRDVVEKARQITKGTINVVEGPRRGGDCAKLVSGSRRAETELGWKPERSNLEDMIRDAWQWHQLPGYDR